MKSSLPISALCGALLLSGCLGANTGDPRQGGLFGYSPKNYEQRIQDRENRYQEVKDENSWLQEESASLEKQKKQKQANVAAQKRDLNQVNSEISSLKAKIRREQAAQTAQNKARKTVKTRQAAPAAVTGESEAQKAAKIRSMQEELKRLEAEADALSRM